MESLENARSLANLRTDVLEAALEKFPEPIRTRGEELLATLDVDLAQQKAHLEELMASLEEGDVDRGQAVFRSSKAACSACHRIGYLGGRIGPDLTRIEKIRSKPDLLESIIFPSATLVRSYEPVVVVTATETYNGVPLEETDESILLATGADTQVRIARDSIEGDSPRRRLHHAGGHRRRVEPHRTCRPHGFPAALAAVRLGPQTIAVAQLACMSHHVARNTG